ncbi:DNA-binding transcriptional regulator, MarR family [Alkalispirochaeta americana]|uniref:DNA-binding transcriptional regulator, MarR family n=1 Tax=Alkalispirochaeta americana TaxID=159291 RepID=A0A1N6SK27_9SPIO|nr:MarR family transcriptional regulator [Alkalispirochaeta americana]SIQ41473.1 DNA-binding transcriptional regulator, MarR family [Alkalispirochaeta americana]
MDDLVAPADASIIMEMVNALTLFTRQTVVRWMPDLAREQGLTAERYMMLFELSLSRDISLKELSRIYGVSSAAVSVMVHSLVEQGLVNRSQDRKDRRRVVLSLTEKGQETLGRLEERLTAQFQVYLEEIPADARREFSLLSRQLVGSVRRIMDQTNGNDG